ncbi:MAG: hypothetical protein RLY43_937 [Bacteroidota bacterium]|jgi:mannosyltransferase OCH1-like enzyme
MIPKIIHYIWLGNNMPSKAEKIIIKNNFYFNNYEVKLWTEKNCKINHPFFKKAIKEEKWAFASDILRFIVLRDYGGVYLDVDMEIIKPIDSLLNVEGFSGYGNIDKYIYCGIIGSKKNNPLINEIISEYLSIPVGKWPTSPEIMTKVYERNPISSFIIHPAKYFYPKKDGDFKKYDLSESFAIHHWHESWRRYVILRKILRRIGLMNIYHALFKIK